MKNNETRVNNLCAKIQGFSDNMRRAKESMRRMGKALAEIMQEQNRLRNRRKRARKRVRK